MTGPLTAFLHARLLDNGMTVVDSPLSRNVVWVYPHPGDEGYWGDESPEAKR
jgi:hypothetical protein